MSNFLNSIKSRRTIYAIGKNLTVDQATIEETIREAVKQSPSSFNSQTSRVVTLYGESHHKFWEIVRETLRKMVPAEAFANTSAKIDSFSAGFGTALFYEDQDVVKGLQEQNDGNNVNLDTQMSEMSKNKILFDAIQSSIKRDSRLFRSVIESSAKN